MRIYLDDKREAPFGWIRTYTVEETIEALETRQVTHLSLDNDLGLPREGYEVLDWLEKTIYFDSTFPVPEVAIHSSNSVRIDHMKRTLESIKRIRQQQAGEA